MKCKSLVCLSSLWVLLSSAALADDIKQTGCAAKLATIGQQIDAAKLAGNHHKVTGLETAHAEVIAHCDDEQLHAERVTKVQEKETVLVERQAELVKAIEEGKSVDKLTKKRTKVAQAEAALAKARAELAE